MNNGLDIPTYKDWIFKAESLVDDSKIARRQVDKDIGHCFREARKRKGLSLRQFGKLLNVSAPYISDLELGQRAWTEEKMEMFEKALEGVPDVDTELEPEEQWI